MTAQEARQRLGEILESARRGDEIAIERAGRLMGVLISPQRYADLQRIQDEAKERFWTKVEEVWTQNANVDPEKIEEFAVEEVHAYRRETREAARERAIVEEREPIETSA